jgi:predicted  nucleic acid-binding Zn-ribbon protein
VITTNDVARQLLQEQIRILEEQDAEAKKSLKASMRRIERLREQRLGLAHAIAGMTKALDSLGGPIEKGQK